MNNVLLNSLLVQLDVISKITPGKKLKIINDIIEVDNSTYDHITRTIYGHNKEKSIIKLTKILDDCIEKSEMYTLNESIDQLDILSKSMQNSIKGLSELVLTYSDKITMQSKLIIIIQTMTRQIEKNISYIKEKNQV